MTVQLDLRRLAVPEPMQRILSALQTLPDGEQLVALTPFEPLPLLPILEQQHFLWQLDPHPSHGFCLTIYRQQQDPPVLTVDQT